MKIASIEILSALLTVGSCDSLGPGCTPLFATGDDDTTSQASGSNTTSPNPTLTMDGQRGSTSQSDETAVGTASESSYASAAKDWENVTSETSGMADTSSDDDPSEASSTGTTYTSSTGGCDACSWASSDEGPPEASSTGTIYGSTSSTGGSTSSTGGCDACSWAGVDYCEGALGKFGAVCTAKTSCSAGPSKGFPCAATPKCWAVCTADGWEPYS